MKRKGILVLCCLYAIQLIISCCPDPGTYEVTHIGMQGNALMFTSQGYENIVGGTTINKEDLAISGSFDTERTKIASVFKKIKGFGFESAMATTCPDDDLIFKTNVASIKIVVEDITNSQEVDISNDFMATNFSGQFYTLEEYVQNQNEFDQTFTFRVSSVQNIPSRAIFKVSALLDSGAILSFATNEINFN
ncbi:hypothetical protein RQM59_04770 [Flavobacteriaceae bacterium S356]|uniref:Uncharacterized protein n=1 Tax=Asprobacillus argus TaxID=3076534 RepID=A0ABU3LD80_9FLAO|nr:hypothetical protein [Flavobacteriaceae bacterium S356]